MSKKYERQQDDLERLEKELREYKAENKALRKKLKVVNKGYYKYLVASDKAEQEEASEQIKAIAIKICYSCNIGNLKLMILGNRYIRKCTNCDYHTKSKSIEDIKEKI